MKIPITKKRLIDWAGETVIKDAESLIGKGFVVEANYEHPFVKGTVLVNNQPMKTSLEVMKDGHVENHCPCYASKERCVICMHSVAVALMVLMRSTDPNREKKYQEEKRRASRIASVDESEYINRASPDIPNAIPAEIIITIESGWKDGFKDNLTKVSCSAEYKKKKVPLDKVPRDLPLAFSNKDESLLDVLEDISEGPALGKLNLNKFDFINLVRLHTGRSILCADGTEIIVNDIKMSTVLKMDMDRENGEIILIAHTELPFMKAGEFPSYIIGGNSGWVYSNQNMWPLKNILPAPYHPIYTEPVIVERPHVLRFLQQELPLMEKETPIASDISIDLFTIEPGTPKFRVVIEGTASWMLATLYVQYGDIELIACKPDAKDNFGIPDPNDLMRYTCRNTEAEKDALEKLLHAGFSGQCGDDLREVSEPRQIMNFLGTHFPSLRREGWKIELTKKLSELMDSMEFVTPIAHILETDGDWFDIGFDFEDSKGSSLSAADIHRAIYNGDSFIKQGNRTFLLDATAIQSMHDVFSDCASGESDKAGHFRMQNIFAAFVKSSLDALDGIDIEDTRNWRDKATQQNRTAEIKPVKLGSPLDKTLRSYQKEGVNWLSFLEENGFAGILADEMGLGKTLQTLAWLQTNRHKKEAQNKPALIVCPTSLVGNWLEEAEKFVPNMKTVMLTGSDRHERWEDVAKSDLAVTSYAIMRRDIDKLTEHKFSVAVLDEAQHIKNRSTGNSVSAKKLKAHSRLVLTGTPLENSVSDLWSIMDFLMPGYLGTHKTFKQHYEIPMNNGKEEAEAAQRKLRRKLHPFLMRRLKTNVAKDLPPKIEKLSLCPLTKDQQAVYTELLRESQRKISNMVSKQGFNKCRMEILATIMRLRQVCCHLDLLKLPNLKSKHPSAKMEMFMELINEAMDGGHRILVFSQFVSMLTIIREELEKQDISYCYLDGSTKDRMGEVKKFNTQRDIPLFLISLKAGGTGLNLTGADMVIHFDPWWNPAVEDQATDRAHRIGQKRTVYSVKLITEGTIEEKVLAMQRKKKAIINATIESDEKMVSSLSYEDVQNLLDL